MKRYFNHGLNRIAIVDSTDESDFDGFENEIDKNDLPDDICDWMQYEGYGVIRGTVVIMSERGD